jgi:DNA-binding CsgD family transcriptional regulator
LRINELRTSDVTSERRLLAGVLVAFLAVAVLAAVDLSTDLREGTTLGHVSAEGGVILVGLAGSLVAARKLALALKRMRAAEALAKSLAERLEVTAADATRWREEARDLLAGLGAALDQQFDRWGLSPAEKEVGLLLLKGLSHKEVGAVRAVTEATARQQARSLYKKAGLAGRHDLAAFFLEDLMLPTEHRA